MSRKSTFLTPKLIYSFKETKMVFISEDVAGENGRRSKDTLLSQTRK